MTKPEIRINVEVRMTKEMLLWTLSVGRWVAWATYSMPVLWPHTENVQRPTFNFQPPKSAIGTTEETCAEAGFVAPRILTPELLMELA